MRHILQRYRLVNPNHSSIAYTVVLKHAFSLVFGILIAIDIQTSKIIYYFASMKTKFLSLFVLMLTKSVIGLAQNYTNCQCQVMLNPSYDGKIIIFQKPGGEIITTLAHDKKKDEFITFTVSNDSAGFYEVSVNQGAIRNKMKGWVRKSANIGTYSSIYNAVEPLKLYNKTYVNSDIRTFIYRSSSYFYTATRCKKRWIYTEVNVGDKPRAGWMSPDSQCSNPYASCN